ncbi:MAG: family 16 glycoside hydrolase [Phycisphaeraceae bacterium]
MFNRNVVGLSIIAIVAMTALFSNVDQAKADTAGAIKALYVTGGGWHDYVAQEPIVTEGLGSRVNIEWTIENEAGNRSDHWPERFKQEDWIADFDVVVYNFCITGTPGVEAVEGVIDQHVKHGVPAVMMHCAIHSFRADTLKWFHFHGMRSHRHEAHRAFKVEPLQSEHPIMIGFPEDGWQTPRGELYEIAEIYDTATPLAHAYGQDTDKHHEVIWTNEYEGVRVFNTTIGHHNETMRESVYLDLVSRGLLWSVEKLQDDGTAADGYAGAGPETVTIDEQQWHVLFNGRDLENWRASENEGVFSIENGTLIVDGPRSHLFYEGPVADADFDDFHFRAEVYTHPQANSGIFFHTKWQENGWPGVGYEAQVNATHGDRIKTGSIYGVSNVLDNTPHEDHQWFLYEIIVKGDQIILKVDGDTVMDYTEREDDIQGNRRLSSGTFAIQGHDPNSRIHYRNIYVRELD